MQLLVHLASWQQPAHSQDAMQTALHKHGACSSLPASPCSTVAATAPGLTWPSLLRTVYVMAGTWPAKPAAGVMVTEPFCCTTTVHAVVALMGSTTKADVPAGNTALEPGRVKPATLTVVPGGARVLSSTFSTAGPLPAAMAMVSLPSSSRELTVTVSGMVARCPSELATVTVTAGTWPV
jgi:hypothetical protein